MDPVGAGSRGLSVSGQRAHQRRKPPVSRVTTEAMSSLLTAAEKAALVADLNQVVETFLQPLTVYQEGSRTVVNSNPNFNPIEDWQQNNTTVTSTPVFSTISGRILWDRQQEWKFSRTPIEAQFKAKDATRQAVRLKVDASGNALLKTAKEVQIDGVLLYPDSQPRPHGLFGTDYYTHYFSRAM